jgi:hypothetical protein
VVGLVTTIGEAADFGTFGQEIISRYLKEKLELPVAHGSMKNKILRRAPLKKQQDSCGADFKVLSGKKFGSGNAGPDKTKRAGRSTAGPFKLA